MRRIEAAENAMPVSVIALATQYESLGLVPSRTKGFVWTADLLQTANLGRNVLHLFVQQIRFTIFREEISPNSAAQKGQFGRTIRELHRQGMVAVPRRGGQGPFHHLGVRSGGKIRTS